MASKLQIQIVDYSLEDSPATFQGVDMNAGNITAQFALMDALSAAVDGITLGTLWKDTRQAAVTESARTQPASPFAQRELKWLVRFSDTVDPVGNGTREIPTPDLALLDNQGEYMDISGGAGAAFVTAFEDFQLSSLGNPVTVDSVQLVGRNL